MAKREHPMLFLMKSSLQRIGIGRVIRVTSMTLLAVVIYGGWAWCANLGEPQRVAFRAAATQGGTSGLSTLFTSSLVELVFARIGISWLGIAASATIPPTLTGLMHGIAQWLVGTPNILVTILPSVVMGYVFAGIYTTGLARVVQQNTF